MKYFLHLSMSELPSVANSDIQDQFKRLLDEADIGDSIHDVVVEVCGFLFFTFWRGFYQVKHFFYI